jgi:hypothetical protein
LGRVEYDEIHVRYMDCTVSPPEERAEVLTGSDKERELDALYNFDAQGVIWIRDVKFLSTSKFFEEG